MKDFNKLYQKALEAHKAVQHKKIGICESILQSDISTEESDALILHLYSNKPSLKQHVHFSQHPSFKGGTGLWWDTSVEGMKQRILFLEYMVEQTKVGWLTNVILRFLNYLT